MTKVNEIYCIPSAITPEVVNVITNQLSTLPLEPGQLGNDLLHQTKRVSDIAWLNTDHWIAGMMAHFMNVANQELFHYDIYAWSDKIQYTVYDTDQSKYDWHCDTSESSYHEGMIRKLSISLCLSDKDDYEGGEFQILPYNNKLTTYKLGMGDAVIFSSDLTHRVRRVRSGKRVSLVGWFAGPKFR